MHVGEKMTTLSGWFLCGISLHNLQNYDCIVQSVALLIKETCHENSSQSEVKEATVEPHNTEFWNIFEAVMTVTTIAASFGSRCWGRQSMGRCGGST